MSLMIRETYHSLLQPRFISNLINFKKHFQFVFLQTGTTPYFKINQMSLATSKTPLLILVTVQRFEAASHLPEMVVVKLCFQKQQCNKQAHFQLGSILSINEVLLPATTPTRALDHF